MKRMGRLSRICDHDFWDGSLWAKVREKTFRDERVPVYMLYFLHGRQGLTSVLLKFATFKSIILLY